MGAAIYPQNDNAEAVSVLFGPQGILTPDTVLELRTTLQENEDLHYLLELTSQLPDLWHSMVEAWPELSTVPAKDKLDKLSAFFNGESMVDITTPVNNVLLCPLTVIVQIVDFWKLTHGLANTLNHDSGLQDVQGFCIGFLTAIAVSCSNNEAQFQVLASKTVRLALCLGAVVDRDSLSALDCALTIAIRWKSADQLEQIQQIMKQYPKTYISVVTDSRTATITVSERDEEVVRSCLSRLNIPTISLTPRGRWHHPEHSRALQAILALCDLDERFRLPDTDALHSCLLSNKDGKIAANGSLHSIALQSILTTQARWDLVFDALSESISHHVFIGEKVTIPRTSNGLSSIKASDAFLNHISSERYPAMTLRDDSEIEYLRAFPEDAVAVIGMACRYPEANDVEQLWDLISQGKCVTRAIPEERFKLSDLRREPKGPFWGGFVRDLAAFDNRFFGIPGREAKSMDPQQRLCLQVAYEAMESAGYYGLRSDEFDCDIGCYIGCANDDYFDNVASHPANAFSLTGTLRSFISGRVSHHLGWTGPSMVLDTACSASAVAIHTACKALKLKECSVAVAGGVCSMSSARMTQHLIAANFLSPTGASRAFDMDADGYCRAEGAGLVVLRLLKDAIQHGDHVLGVVCGTAINQGSNETAIFVPDGQSQVSLCQKVLANSGTTPAEITYVEAHGTGTQVGDPIEFESIRKILGGAQRENDVFVGSLKDNIGHTEASSGTASLIKTILMMQKDTIPKQANFKRLNPKIEPLGKDRVLIPTTPREWKAAKRTALINNYGSCGSNAAIVLRDPTLTSSRLARRIPIEMGQYPIIISGKTAESIHSFSKCLKDLLVKQTHNKLSDIAYNLSLKQNQDFEYRLILTSSDTTDLLSQLEKAASIAINPPQVPAYKPPVILCFGGQDGRTAHLSKDLYNRSALLQRHISDCDRVCTEQLSLTSLFPTIFSPEPIEDIVNLHCVLFAIQYACAKSWLDSGLKVDRLLGHSFGQLTALCVSGSLSLLDTISLISERARLIERHVGTESGLMLAFEGSEDSLNCCLELARKNCQYFSADIACFNGPRSFVIAGDEASITAFEQASKVIVNNVRTKRLENSHGFHSRFLDGIIPDLLRKAETLKLSSPKIPIEACSGESWSLVTPDMIARHTREPVRFAEAVKRIEHDFDKAVIWLEAGSGSSIIPILKRAVGSNTQHVYLPTHLRNADAQLNLTKATCSLWTNGVKAQFWPFHRSQSASYKWINLPPYQFAKTKHWLEYKPTPTWDLSCAVIAEEPQQELIRLLLDSANEGEHLFEINHEHDTYQLSTKAHEIDGQPTCPASMYIDFVLTAAQLLKGSTTPFVPQISSSISFSPLTLDPKGRVLLKLIKHNTELESWGFTLFTLNEQEKSAEPVTHAKGCINVLNSEAPSTTISNFQSLGTLILQRCCEIENSSRSIGFKGPTVYRAMRPSVTYLDYYHGIQSIYSMGNEAVARIALPITRPAAMGTGFCHPVLVDNFIQVSSILVNCFVRDMDQEAWVCNSTGEMIFTPKFVETAMEDKAWTVYSKYKQTTTETLQCDVFVFESDSDQLVLTIMAVSFQRSLIRALEKVHSGLTHLSQNQTQDTVAKVTSSSTEIKSFNYDAAQPVPMHSVPINSYSQHKYFGENTRANTNLEHDRSPAATTTVALSDATTDSSSDILHRVKQMLSDIVEVSVEEIASDSNFESLGVDSLFLTEIFAEVNQRFGVSLSHSDLATIHNVRDFAQHISGSTSSSIRNKPLATNMISSSTSTSLSRSSSPQRPVVMETFVYGERDGTPLSADIYYPSERILAQKPLPIALMIHGGGHTMSTRKDIRHDQTQILLKSGFIGVSVDYRLCPEVTLREGPMRDVCDALFWVRHRLPKLTLTRSDVQIDGQKVVAVGWSSGGHLAMSLGWTARSLGIAPPEAVLAFYCPTDYEDEFWTKPNLPYLQKPVPPPDATYNHLYDGLRDKAIVGYSPAASLRALGGWMSLDDPRSRIVLHMNWEGKHLPVLLGGLRRTGEPAHKLVTTPPEPLIEDIRDISPLAHISAGDYTTPTFLIHGTRDDHVPWQQSKRTHEALLQKGVPAELAVVQDALHLFDMLPTFKRNTSAVKAVNDGLNFIRTFV